MQLYGSVASCVAQGGGKTTGQVLMVQIFYSIISQRCCRTQGPSRVWTH